MKPRKPSARVVLNRGAVSKVELALADGTHAAGRAIIEATDPPDATPYGEGLVDRGGVLTYVDDRKVDGWSTGGKQPKKPRKIRVRGAHLIQTIVGFGFPGRFQETGTIHHEAQPFLTPAVRQVAGSIPRIIASVLRVRFGTAP